MEEKYVSIYKQITSKTEKLALEVKPDTLINALKEGVTSKMSQVHSKLDNKRNELVELALTAHNKDIETTQEKDQGLNNDIIKETKESAEIKDPTSTTIPTTTPIRENRVTKFRNKIKDIISDIDSALKKTEVLEETISIFSRPKVTDIIEIKKDDFNFKGIHKLRFKALGKQEYSIGWNKTINKPNNSNIDPDDPTNLKVHSTSCYNYYSTDKIIEDMAVMVRFSTNVTSSNNYLYFGITNENIVENSHCMCCNVKNAWYFQNNGNTHNNAVAKVYNELKYSDKTTKPNEILVKLFPREKEVFFQVNEGGNVGPFIINGSKFKIVAGTCNNANGYIKIEDSFLIG